MEDSFFWGVGAGGDMGGGSGGNASGREPQMKLCLLARSSPPVVCPVPNRPLTSTGPRPVADPSCSEWVLNKWWLIL